MSSGAIFVVAIVVFALMVTGLILTMYEFNKVTNDPSKRKGT